MSESLVGRKIEIEITHYRGFVRGDDIFTVGSVHRVCEPSNAFIKADGNGKRGYWIKGSNDLPILILHGEYLIEEYYAIQ